MPQVTTRTVSEVDATSAVLSDALPHWIHFSLVRIAQLATDRPPDANDPDLVIAAARLARHARTAHLAPDLTLRALTFVLDRAWGTRPWPLRRPAPGSPDEQRNRLVDVALTAYFSGD